MIAILKKEIITFFATPIGYLVIALFLIFTGFFLWIFDGEFNIPNSGFADLAPFFQLAPWIFIFLIPAVTMRSFSDEQKAGTLELLLTKPITTSKLIFGKFTGALLLIILALIPTLIYVVAIYNLGNPIGNLDIGVTLGSYVGLLFLASTYTSIGIFASSITNNQIVAFITAVFISFIGYFGFEGIASYNLSSTTASLVSQLGMQAHYDSLSRGVIDTRDLIYFVSSALLFLFLTKRNVQKTAQGKSKDSAYAKILAKTPTLVIGLIGFVLLNYLASLAHGRFDLTQDQRYSLSDPAKDILDKIKSPIIIDVFLQGELPAEFKKLQSETRYLLEEMKAYNRNINFVFSNPVEDGQNTTEVSAQFNEFGMRTIPLKIKKNGKEEIQTIFPWAMINYNNKAFPVSLVKNITGASPEQLIYSSIQNLEYAFADGFMKSIQDKSKKIAVLRDNGELSDAQIADMFRSLIDTYSIAPFPMDAAEQDPEKALNALTNTFDLIVIAKPTKAFTDKQKYVIDQYIMNGGSSLWLLDVVGMEDDSLRNPTGEALAYPRDLNIDDQLFKYGIRLNQSLVKDLYSAPLSLASGDGSDSQYVQLPWFYRPQVPGLNTHPINTNIENPVRFNYASPIELLNNTTALKKTILLSSSPLSSLEKVPRQIALAQVDVEPKEKDYNAGPQTLAVLIEGTFDSAFKNRVLPTDLTENRFRESASKPSKMIVISDGDLIANEVDRKGQPLELGFDYYTRKSYGNKEFLQNTVNYLLDDTGLINIRSKELALPFLNGQKMVQTITMWQVLTIGLPLILLVAFGLVFNLLRKRIYAY